MVNTDVWTDSERYYFTVYRNSERYEGGIRYVFRDEMDEYTFFPYADGGLNTVPEYLKDRDAFETVNIYLWVEKEKRFAKVLCRCIQAQKRIFITESGFNRYWKQISKGISQERKGEAVDLSLLTSPGRLPEMEENDKSYAGQKVTWWKRWIEGIRKIRGRKLDAVVAFYPNNVYTKYIHKGGDDMQAQIKSWGNSQGIRIPKEILKGAGISLNDVVEISCSDGVIVLTKSFKHRTLEERAAEYEGQLKLDGEFDWGTPVGREVW